MDRKFRLQGSHAARRANAPAAAAARTARTASLNHRVVFVTSFLRKKTPFNGAMRSLISLSYPFLTGFDGRRRGMSRRLRFSYHI